VVDQCLQPQDEKCFSAVDARYSVAHFGYLSSYLC